MKTLINLAKEFISKFNTRESVYENDSEAGLNLDMELVNEALNIAEESLIAVKKAEDDSIYYENQIEKIIESYSKTLSEKLNKEGYSISIFQTTEYYEDDSVEENSIYAGKPMYEAYIMDENEESIDDYYTGRYCDVLSVLEEAESIVEQFNHEN